MRLASARATEPGPDGANVRGVRPLLSAVVLRSQTDERLVALARDGHDQAFVTIMSRYRRELFAHARRIAPAEVSEDIVQQAMLSAWSALGRQVEVLDVRAWLHRIVHNAALGVAQRSVQHDELSEAFAAETSTDIAVERRFEAREALVAVAALPERQRRALELTALGGVSGTVAAAELGVSEGTLRQLVHRARATLRSGIAALTPAPLLSWAAGGSSETVASRIAELGAGAGLAATVTKVAATVAVTASVVGGATQMLPIGHDHARAHHHPLAAKHSANEAQALGDPLGRGARSAGATHLVTATTGNADQTGPQRGQSGQNVQANDQRSQGANGHRGVNGVGQAGGSNGTGGRDRGAAGGATGQVGNQGASGAAGVPTAGPGTGTDGSTQSGAAGAQTGGQASASSSQSGSSGTSGASGANQP